MNDKVFIYNGITNEEFIREMTDDEQAQRNTEAAQAIEQKAQAKAEAEVLRATKISAYQKLGLTEAEIEALLPTPKPPLA